MVLLIASRFIVEIWSALLGCGERLQDNAYITNG